MSLIKKYLEKMIEENASDLFIRAGGLVRMRVDGNVTAVDDHILSVEEVFEAVKEITNEPQKEQFRKNRDVDFAFYSQELDHRFRVSLFLQRNWPSMVIRLVKNASQTFEELGLPKDVLSALCAESRGLVLLTGSAGSGKSTTIASMINYINENMKKHILTVEEPIEFTFQDRRCVINQRELGLDVSSYATALRAFTLQSPDVIFIGNIRDQDTMFSAMTAAETGVLVFSTLHTINAFQSVERIVNFFPPHQHGEIRTQLSYVLKGVISLRLVPRKDGTGRVPAYEVMLLTPTIARLIRENKIWEMPHFIEEGQIFGMQSFMQSLVKLVRDGVITEEVGAEFSDNKEEFYQALKGIKKLGLE
jgi:twitching motility protein PilT